MLKEFFFISALPSYVFPENFLFRPSHENFSGSAIDAAYVHLNAPNILSLIVDGALTSCSLYFDDVLSLVEAKFCYHVHDYGYIPFYDKYEEQDDLKENISYYLSMSSTSLNLKTWDKV